ncbi:MAG: sulfotransferase [Acidobacteriota bacterium]|jgi:hypothetical protein
MTATRPSSDGPVRSLRRGFTPAFRQLTWRLRPLPGLIVIGAQKAGTTSLHYFLGQHPQLCPSLTKEVHFFDGGLERGVDTYAEGEAWYRAQFPLRRHVMNGGLAYETTPLYIFNPLAPKRIAAMIPGAKIVAVLRNPVQRAVSHYFKARRRGRESLPIMDAVKMEETRLAPALEQRDYKHPAFIRNSYKRRGLYREQLERYLEHFPRRQILILDSNPLFQDPHKTLRRIFKFAGVDPDFEPRDLRPQNVGRNRADVPREVYAYLEDYFRPHNQALYELLGEDYGW